MEQQFFVIGDMRVTELKHFDPAIHVEEDQLQAAGYSKPEPGDVIEIRKNMDGLIKQTRLSVDGRIYLDQVLNGEAEKAVTCTQTQTASRGAH